MVTVWDTLSMLCFRRQVGLPCAQVDLWKKSGHFEFYSENMFDQMEVEGEEYQLRPMNCPFHIAIYNVSLATISLALPLARALPLLHLQCDFCHGFRTPPHRTQYFCADSLSIDWLDTGMSQVLFPISIYHVTLATASHPPLLAPRYIREARSPITRSTNQYKAATSSKDAVDELCVSA